MNNAALSNRLAKPPDPSENLLESVEFCPACSAMLLQIRADHGLSRTQLIHHNDFKSFVQGELLHCYICNLIRLTLTSFFTSFPEADSSSYLQKLEKAIPFTYYKLSWREPDENICILIEIPVQRDSLIAAQRTNTQIPVLTLPIESSFISFNDAGYSHDFYKKKTVPFDKATLKTAKKWLDKCINHHTLCMKDVQLQIEDGFVPSRLLYVGTEAAPDLRLIETDGQDIKSPYCTISHCWGTKPFKRLLKSNVRAMKTSINVEELPQNFIDAITVARVLEVQYLWIDSLCIIQDSEADWQEQVLLMAEVYSNARCSIAGTRAGCADDGLFAPKSTLPVPRDEGKSLFFLFNDTCLKRFSRQSYNEHAKLLRSHIDDSPLCQRAWVYQERLIAPRILHFTHDQMVWECFEESISELDPNVSLQSHSHRRSRKPSLQFTGAINQLSSLNSQISAICESWMSLVEAYSKCKLTRSDDGLVALAGIAQRVKPLIKSKYYAGLWEHCFIRQLIWSSEAKERTHRGDITIAPSWSWASVTGPVKFYRSSMPDEITSLVDCRIETAVVGDPYGQYRSGQLKLSGPLIEGVATLTNSSTNKDSHVRTHTVTLKNSSIRIYADPIIGVCYTSDIAIVYAPMLGTGHGYEYGLLLRPLPKGPSGYYSRIAFVAGPISNLSGPTHNSDRTGTSSSARSIEDGVYLKGRELERHYCIL